MNSQAHLHRANAFIIYRALGGKEAINKVWPMKGENKKEKIVMDAEMWAKIKASHNIK